MRRRGAFAEDVNAHLVCVVDLLFLLYLLMIIITELMILMVEEDSDKVVVGHDVGEGLKV